LSSHIDVFSCFASRAATENIFTLKKMSNCPDTCPEHPVVSVIIPAYNHENYIRDCIHSVLEQDYQSIDLIVINDGSTDDTDKKIRAILKENPACFRYVSQANEGLIKTLNIGLKMSRGRYICELASDDILVPGSIRKRVEFLEANPDIDVVFADRYLLDGNARTNVRTSEGKERYYRNPEYTVWDLITGKVRIQFSSGMFRKAILEKLGGFDEDFRFYEDIAMQYHLAIHTKIGYLDEPVMYWRKHSANTSSTTRFWVRKEKMLALEKLLSLKNGDMAGFIRKHLYREYVRFVKFSLTHPADKKELEEVYRKAITMCPYSLRIRYYMMHSKIKG